MFKNKRFKKNAIKTKKFYYILILIVEMNMNMNVSILMKYIHVITKILYINESNFKHILHKKNKSKNFQIKLK
jgi:type IV secretory pathway VirB3-like protein